MASPRSRDHIFIKSEYGRIADLISFVALIFAVAYIGIQPISSSHRVSIKATNSSWFAKRPVSIVTPPQRTALPKSLKPTASPKAKDEKAILFSAFDSILASYTPPATTDSAPIAGKPIIKPETKKPAPANPETLALFSKLKSLLADQSEPSEELSIDLFSILKKFLANPEIRKSELKTNTVIDKKQTPIAKATSTSTKQKPAAQSAAPASATPEYKTILSLLQGLLADPKQRGASSGTKVDISSSIISGVKSFMAAPPSPKSEKAETKKEEASTAKKAPVPEDPAPTNARDSSGEILSALKSLLDQYDAKVREYKDAPKENPTVKEQPPVVREQPRVSVKKPSAQKKETTSKAPWSFLANFLADSEEAARPLGTQEYGLIYSYFQSFLAQPQPETPKTPPKPNTKAEKPEPAPVQRKASTQPPKSSKPKKKSTAGPSFDMFSSFQYLLADQKAPKKPQEPVYTSGSLAEFLQSLLAEPTAPSKKRSKPSTSWNWQDILAAPQAQKKQSTAGKVFENIYKSNSMKDLGNAFSSLLAGSEPSKSSMDLSSFKSLFASLLASNDFDQAKKSFRKLVKDSVNPDIDTSRQEEPVKEFFSEWSASSNEAPFHILDFLKSLLADQTPDQTKSKGKLWDAVFTEPEEPLVFASTSEPQTSTTCQKGFRGVDSTWDSFCSSNCPKGKCPVSLCQCETGDEKLICKDNRYATLPGKKFLCQASCNVAPFNCPKNECGCKNPGMESTQRCTSPSVCKTGKFTAIPGTIATNQWCQSQCSEQSDSRYCPCTLCECSDSCGQTIENGDFEQGLKGWNIIRQSGSLGLVTTVQAGAVSPVSSKPITAHGKQGNKVALFDGSSSGSYVLYQEIAPKAGDSLFLSWTVSNYKSFSNRPESLAANTKGNQQFRIDIIKPDSTAWFNPENGNKDVLSNVLSPTRVGAVVSSLGKPPYSDSNAWRSLRYDLDAFAGQKVILAFRSVNNLGVMNVGIDDVRIQNVACGQDVPTFAKSTKPVKMEEQGPSCGAICQTSF